MRSLDDFKYHLPRYLTEESTKHLFEEIRNFPDNIDGRIFTTRLKDEKTIFQGDGISNLPVISLPSTNSINAKVMVFSNTCDIDPQNDRPFNVQICYAPIFSMDKYKAMLEQNLSEEAVEGHLRSVKNQEITQIFYLPYHPDVEGESVVFFDRINNFDRRYIEADQIPKQRLFTLSDYGFYLFLIKLSIHFTRIGEKVERGSTDFVVN
jgi:hypothetical protein